MYSKLSVSAFALVVGTVLLAGCAEKPPVFDDLVKAATLPPTVDCGSYTTGFVLPEPGGPQTPAEAIGEWKGWIEEATRTGADLSGGLSSAEDMLLTAEAAADAVGTTETVRWEHGTETRVAAKDSDGNLLGIVVVTGDEEVGFVVSEYWILHEDGQFCSPPEAALSGM